MIHHQLGKLQPLRWFIPVADLVEIFHREPQPHPKVSSRWIIDCGVEFRAAVEAVRFGGELLFPKYARPGPFLQEQLLDFWIGGFDDMVHFSLVAWQKFLQWLLDGPPDPPPPELTLDSRKRHGLRELLSLGRPNASDMAVLPEGAVLIGPQATGHVEPTQPNETGLYGYDGTSVLFCDVDGDGDPEEISGAPGWSLPGKPLLGQVNIRKPSGGTWSLHAPDDHVGGRFGHSLACGDFDADGIDDLAVGSPTRGPIDQVFERQAYSGRVDVFFGAKGGLTNASWSASAVGPADLFGFSLLALPAPGTPQRRDGGGGRGRIPWLASWGEVWELYLCTRSRAFHRSSWAFRSWQLEHGSSWCHLHCEPRAFGIGAVRDRTSWPFRSFLWHRGIQVGSGTAWEIKEGLSARRHLCGRSAFAGHGCPKQWHSARGRAGAALPSQSLGSLRLVHRLQWKAAGSWGALRG